MRSDPAASRILIFRTAVVREMRGERCRPRDADPPIAASISADAQLPYAFPMGHCRCAVCDEAGRDAQPSV
jgi:hypothetical protein